MTTDPTGTTKADEVVRLMLHAADLLAATRDDDEGKYRADMPRYVANITAEHTLRWVALFIRDESDGAS